MHTDVRANAYQGIVTTAGCTAVVVMAKTSSYPNPIITPKPTQSKAYTVNPLRPKPHSLKPKKQP